MARIDTAGVELREMDELAAMVSPIHALHPLTKLAATVAYILITLSFPRYAFSALTGMVLYPALLFALSGVGVGVCLRKLRFVLPLVLAVGLANPLLDRAPVLQLGAVTVSGGTVSLLTLAVKGLFCLSATFLLAATTRVDAICAALRRLHVPELPLTLLLLTWRYLALTVEEAGLLWTAYKLRAPGQRGLNIRVWGSFLGQLLLRSMDRAEEIYDSMRLRGFNGDFPYALLPSPGLKDGVFLLLSVGGMILLRCVNLAQLLGAGITGGLL